MDIIQWLILIAGISLGIYINTVLGFAAGLIAIPILMNVLSLQESIALMSIFFVIFSFLLIYRNWKLINRKVVLELAFGIIIGLIIGVSILKYGSPIILKKALGVFIIFYVIYSYTKKKKVEIFNKLAIPFGFLGGIFSGLFGTGGPLIVVYIFNKLDKSNIIRATIIGALGITNIVRIPILIYYDILTFEIAYMAMVISPFFILAIYFGERTYDKVNEVFFKNIVMVLLIFSGINLII